MTTTVSANQPINVMFSLKKSLGTVLLISCAFPWSSPYPITSDTQPVAFTIAIIYCIFFIKSINKNSIYIYFLLYGAIIAFTINPGNEAARGIFGYLSIAAIPTALVDHYDKYGPPSYRFYRNTLIIWTIIGLAQFSNPEIVSFLSSRDGVFALTGGRGTMSFAPEPTFYGIWLTLILLSITTQQKHEKFLTKNQSLFLIALIIAQITLISKSSLIILIFLISSIIYLILYHPIKIAFTLSLIGAIGTYSSTTIGSLDNSNLIESSRFLYLISAFSSATLSDLLLLDGSISDRAVQIITSHYSAVSNFLMPHGFGVWSEEANSIPHFLNSPYNSIAGLNRILSLSGSILYETGFFSVAFLFFFFKKSSEKINGSGFRANLIKWSFLIMFFTQAIPLALPTLSFFFSMLFLPNSKNKNPTKQIDNPH